MYSSAAKSCAYVAEATPWSPLCTALDVCMRVCVGGQERGGEGGAGGSKGDERDSSDAGVLFGWSFGEGGAQQQRS